VVNRYACAATRAASGISGMMFPTSSTDKHDESKFCVRFSLCGRSAFPLLCFGSRYLSSLECDALLHSSHFVMFAVLADS
jgi:hypothetical protein